MNDDMTYSVTIETADGESYEYRAEAAYPLPLPGGLNIIQRAVTVLRAYLGEPKYDMGPGVFYGEWKYSDRTTGAVKRTIVTFNGLGPENEASLRRLVGWGGR